MGWKLIRSYSFPLTHAAAAFHHNLPTLPEERVVRPQRIKALEHQFKLGCIAFMWATALCDNVVYRVNGGHTSFMFSDGIRQIPKDAAVSMQEYHCDTMHDVSSLWTMFDFSSSARSQSHNISAMCSTEPTLAAMSSRTRKLSTAICGWILTGGFCSMNVPVDRRFQCLCDNKAFFQFLDGLLKKQEPLYLLEKVGIGVAVYQTYKVSPAHAKLFWEWVVTGSFPERGHPSRLLRDRLIAAAPTAGEQRQRQRRSSGMGAEHFNYIAISAWNAFRSGSFPKRLTVGDTAPAPI